MPKTNPVGIRFEPETKAALDQAAKAEGRSLANLVGRVMATWLRKNGFLKCVPLMLGVALGGGLFHPQPGHASDGLTREQAFQIVSVAWMTCVKQTFPGMANHASSRVQAVEQSFAACQPREKLIYAIRPNPETRKEVALVKIRFLNDLAGSGR